MSNHQGAKSYRIWIAGTNPQLSLLDPYLQANPELMFVPDTGHLWLAGDDLLQVLEKTRDRLVAVHLKDWRPDYGFSFAGFSRAFLM